MIECTETGRIIAHTTMQCRTYQIQRVSTFQILYKKNYYKSILTLYAFYFKEAYAHTSNGNAIYIMNILISVKYNNISIHVTCTCRLWKKKSCCTANTFGIV